MSAIVARPCGAAFDSGSTLWQHGSSTLAACSIKVLVMQRAFAMCQMQHDQHFLQDVPWHDMLLEPQARANKSKVVLQVLMKPFPVMF